MKTMYKLCCVIGCLLLLITAVPTGVSAQNELTVTSVTAEDLTITEGTSGQWLNINSPTEWYYYLLDETVFTVTYSDGSSESGTPMELGRYFGSGAIQMVDDQSADHPWGVGTHTVPFTCGDITGSFTVTIVETPVASVTAAPATVVYHADGYYNSYTDPETGITQKNAWFYHLVATPYVTVTFKDGTSIEGTPADIRKQTGEPVAYRIPQSYGNELAIGDNEAGIVFMGARAPLTVTVVDLIDGVEWVDLPAKRTYFYGERPDLSGGKLRIRYTDGTFEDVPIENAMTDPAVTVPRLNNTYSLKNRTPRYAVTSSDMSFTLWDATLTDTVTVRPIPTEITLSADENHELTLTVDGIPLKLLAYAPTSYTYGADSDWFKMIGWEETTGRLHTDGGVFVVTFTRDRNKRLTLSLGDNLFIDVYAVSNQIEDGSWLDALLCSKYIAYTLCDFRGDTNRFDGTVTIDNADNLLRMAVQLYTDYPSIVPGDSLPYYSIDRSFAEDLLTTAYGSSVDLTASVLYDFDTDSVLVPKATDERTDNVHHTTPVYSDGAWRAVMYSDNQTVYTFSMNDEFQLTAHDIRRIGDISGDDTLDMLDAFALYNTASGDDGLDAVQIAAADMNTDGDLDMSDAFALYAIVSGE